MSHLVLRNATSATQISNELHHVDSRYGSSARDQCDIGMVTSNFVGVPRKQPSEYGYSVLRW